MPDNLAPVSTMMSNAMLETNNYLIDEVAFMNTVGHFVFHKYFTHTHI